MSYVRVLCTLLLGAVGAPQPRPSPLPYPDALYADAMDARAKAQSLVERLEFLLGRPKWVSPQTADAAEAATDAIFWMAHDASRTEAA